MDFPDGVAQYWGACKVCKDKTYLGVTSDTCTKCKMGKTEPKAKEPEDSLTPAIVVCPEPPAKAPPKTKEGPKPKPKAREVSKAKISPQAPPKAKEGPEKLGEWQWDETRKMWVIRNEKGRVVQATKVIPNG